ncbi:hypothetical protein D3C80_1814470 [compost metagenome]
MLLRKIIEIAARRKHTAHTPLGHTAQRIEEAEFPAARRFIQVRAPDMPAKLRRFNPATQQRQPQTGVELSVKEETLIAIRFCFGDNGFRQRRFVGKAGQRQRRVSVA